MNKRFMVYFLLLISILGFLLWSKLQFDFTTCSYNKLDQNRLLFPIFVPVLASFLVLLFYLFYMGFNLSASLENMKLAWTISQNRKIIILSSIGLGISYLLYPLIIKNGFEFTVLVTVGITLGLSIISMILNKDFSILKIIGSVLIITGIILLRIKDIELVVKNIFGIK